jgi:glc operon protein GlcG
MNRIRNLIILAFVFSPAVLAADASYKPVMTLERARAVIAGALEFARAHEAPGGAIAVVDDGGNLVALERLDNTFAASAMISWEKARTAAQFQKPTRQLEDTVNPGRTAMVTLPGYTLLRGAVPILHEGRVIGAVGVSGAASAQQDDEIAVAGAAQPSTPN